MRDLLNDLTQQWDVLENEPSNTAAWTAFLEQTRALHERATIFRYKSLERLKAQKVEEVEGVLETVQEQPTMVWQSNPSKEEAVTTPPEPPLVAESAVTSSEIDHSENSESEELLAPKETLSLAESLSLQPINAILPALGINDRMRFARALFGGDLDAFKSACSAAESAADFNTAKDAITSLVASEIDWENEEEAGHQFMQLVQRLHL